ncbi:MAG: sensor histidine kinase [Acidimicrobiales bacterium]
MIRDAREAAPFVGATALAFATLALPGVGFRNGIEILVAGVLAAASLTAWVVPPPAWASGIAPVGFLGVVALMRDAQGGAISVFAPLVVLPVLWIALHGTTRQLLTVVCGAGAAFLVPIAAVGAPSYPSGDLGRGILWPAVTGIIGYAVHKLVHEQRRESAALAELEQRQALVLVATGAGILEVDLAGTITFADDLAAEMTGHDAASLVGQPHRVVTGPPPGAGGAGWPGVDAGRPLEETIADGHLRTCDEEVFWRADATSFPVVYWAAAIHRGGCRTGTVVAFRDITVQVAAGEARRANERLREEFVALVSHELRTPLTAIVGYLEILLDEAGSLAPDHARFLATVDRNAKRLLGLVGDLLETAHIDSGRLTVELEETDLTEIVSAAVESAQPRAQAAGVSLQLCGRKSVQVVADAGRIGQVVDNLLTNAIKFTPAGGRVHLSLRDSEGRAVIEVADTGIGIPGAEQEQLFLRFFRATTATERGIPGIGLGLAIVKSIVEAHRGTISFSSSEASGTTFRIELPSGQAAPSASEPARSACPAAAGGLAG